MNQKYSALQRKPNPKWHHPESKIWGICGHRILLYTCIRSNRKAYGLVSLRKNLCVLRLVQAKAKAGDACPKPKTSLLEVFPLSREPADPPGPGSSGSCLPASAAVFFPSRWLQQQVSPDWASSALLSSGLE